MARGWESKSVEVQIDMAEARRAVRPGRVQTTEISEAIRRKETILLSRTRVVHDLESAQNPRYKAVLSKALAELDAQLSALAVK